MRVKYSPLPNAKPETTELLAPDPDPDFPGRVWFIDDANEVKNLTLAVSLWSLTLKS
jgi:hypothetical protein